MARLSYREHGNRRCKLDIAELRAVLAAENDFSWPEKYKNGTANAASCS